MHLFFTKMLLKEKSILEINSKKFNQNIENIFKISNNNIYLVIKSNAYGHGIYEISQLADRNKYIDLICTESLSEAIRIKEIGIKKNILILSFIDGDIDDYKYGIDNNIIFKISNIHEARNINYIATKFKKIAKCHIKIDTGLSRLGFNIDDKNILEVFNLKNIIIDGIFTHLADSQNNFENFSNTQINKFNNFINFLNKNSIKINIKHIYSSSSIGFSFIKNNIIRAGGLAYGLFKSDYHKNFLEKQYKELEFKQILTWKTYIIEIKELNENTFVGYNLTFKTKKITKIAIIPIGYYDGYPRSLSNNIYCIIKNKKANIIGIISMNLTIIDITNIEDIKLYEEVILTSDHQDIYGHIIANKCNLITNEFISKIDKSIKRIII